MITVLACDRNQKETERIREDCSSSTAMHGDESMPSCMVGWAVTSGRLTGFSVAEALAE